MEKKLCLTADGSYTVALPQLGVTYHSMHGAVQESLHVFINAGLGSVLPRNDGSTPLHILEMGFGTGLNALLTLQYALQHRVAVSYVAVERFPLEDETLAALGYGGGEDGRWTDYFRLLHRAAWEIPVQLHPLFCLHKYPADFQDFHPVGLFDLVYYDAFAPNVQPELWTSDIFRKLYAVLQPGGVLTTYCAKGDVRRTLLAEGFVVEKLPGPPGKREMLRARKPNLAEVSP